MFLLLNFLAQWTLLNEKEIMSKKWCKRNPGTFFCMKFKFVVFKTKNWHDDLVNEYHEYFDPSKDQILETETKLKFKFDQNIYKPNLPVLNFEEKLLLTNWFWQRKLKQIVFALQNRVRGLASLASFQPNGFCATQKVFKRQLWHLLH